MGDELELLNQSMCPLHDQMRPCPSCKRGDKPVFKYKVFALTMGSDGIEEPDYRDLLQLALNDMGRQGHEVISVLLVNGQFHVVVRAHRP